MKRRLLCCLAMTVNDIHVVVCAGNSYFKQLIYFF